MAVGYVVFGPGAGGDAVGLVEHGADLAFAQHRQSRKADFGYNGVLPLGSSL